MCQPIAHYLTHGLTPTHVNRDMESSRPIYKSNTCQLYYLEYCREIQYCPKKIFPTE